MDTKGAVFMSIYHFKYHDVAEQCSPVQPTVDTSRGKQISAVSTAC